MVAVEIHEPMEMWFSSIHSLIDTTQEASKYERNMNVSVYVLIFSDANISNLFQTPV